MRHVDTATNTRKRYAELATEIVGRRREGQVLLLGIDGAGAARKSTLASGIAAASELIAVVHMDDFYRPNSARYSGNLTLRPNGAEFDRERLAREALEPLRDGREIAYRRYDWSTDAIDEAPISITRPIVVEGVYALSAPCSRSMTSRPGWTAGGRCVWLVAWRGMAKAPGRARLTIGCCGRRPIYAV